MIGVENIEELLREQRLQWFGHVELMADKRTRVKAKKIVVDGLKRGRPKKGWKKVTKKDMLAGGLQRSDAQDHAVRRLGCKN